MKLGYCKFCGEHTHLIDAHIVPECFLDNLKADSGSPVYVSNVPTSRPMRLPIGFYDQNILCRDCDNSLSGWEDYSATLLYRANDVYTLSAQAGRDGKAEYEVGPYEYNKLKLCILSIMWRLSVSDSPLSRTFSLGPFEKDVLVILKSNDAGDVDTYGMAIYRMFGDMASRSMQGPRQKRDQQSGINFVLVSAPGYMAIIKVDHRKLDQSSSALTLAPHKPLIVGLLEYENLFETTKPMAFAAMRRRKRKL